LSKKGKVGKNTEIYIQIGIIFVKKALSWIFSEHFYDKSDTFLKSSDLEISYQKFKSVIMIAQVSNNKLFHMKEWYCRRFK